MALDFYQGVVLDYLRADRAIFVNTECCIQLIKNPNPDKSGPHWYCDAVAVELLKREVFLCEISYAKGLVSLTKRLKEWSQHWPKVRTALERDCEIPEGWSVRPWLFVPTKSIGAIVHTLELIKGADDAPFFKARITPLEKVQPWLYHSWNHQDCMTDKAEVPEAYRS
jgi:hypothetical protein